MENNTSTCQQYQQLLYLFFFLLFKLIKGIKIKNERGKLLRAQPPHRGSQAREKRRDPGALLYDARGAGRRRFSGRLARPLRPGAVGRRRHHPLRRSALHGRDRQGPLPRKEGADPLSRGGVLAGRVVRRRGIRGFPRSHGRLLCEHHGRREGADRHLLHVVQRAEGSGVDSRRPARDFRSRP